MLTGKMRRVSFEKLKKATTLKKWVAKKGEKGLVMKIKCDVDDNHVLLAKCGDDGDSVFNSVLSYHIVEIRKCLQD